MCYNWGVMWVGVKDGTNKGKQNWRMCEQFADDRYSPVGPPPPPRMACLPDGDQAGMQETSLF